jgi:hypothetical protein
MNFEPPGAIATFNAPYEARAKVARIYVATGQTNIANEPEFVRARNLGITTYVLSCKDTTTVPAWYGTIPAGLTWYGINHHEPEDDIANASFTLAQWKSWQATHLAAIRSKGGIPSVCFMSYTVNPVSGRVIADYKLPAGQADVAFWDYYPNKESKVSQATTVSRLKAGNATLGISRYGIAEYGILNGSTFNAATVDEFQSLTTDAEVETYWSNQQAENQKFTDAVANAWYS